MNPDCGLRELKRRRTRRGIEDAAITLIADRGFDDVTIEDICAAAEISRRTFFNYFSTKDDAIFGRGMLSFGDAEAEAFSEAASRPGASPHSALLDIIEAGVASPSQEDDDLPAAERSARHRRLRALRREIINATPSLLTISMTSQAAALRRMRAVVADHLSAHDDARVMPELTVDEEAGLITGLVREALWFAVFHDRVDVDGTPIHDAADLITRFSKELNK
ncbi:TetR family transcriptional regulator [Corynebacterium hansenii]|uniref:TetR family transcriptional regulator n=1 Tax=Corynebacterium hansenii TaxID=394964 RepID=A0ABV7ZS29_9CORY|nr:TetR/AcrR family transcriptional regulator [Corynebacterium hansenii]WJZ00612.1 Transcriptional regulator, TetR family [Corynebacterium hansenii]